MKKNNNNKYCLVLVDVSLSAVRLLLKALSSIYASIVIAMWLYCIHIDMIVNVIKVLLQTKKNKIFNLQSTE